MTRSSNFVPLTPVLVSRRQTRTTVGLGWATQGEGGEEWARGPCDSVQGGATCADEVNGRLRGEC